MGLLRRSWLLVVSATVALSSAASCSEFADDDGPAPARDAGTDSGGDGACQEGCPVCGDGVVQSPERCDTAIAAGQPGACPTACTDTRPCSKGTLTGCSAVNDDDCGASGDPCSARGDGVYCGNVLSASLDEYSRYFCKDGVTLGIASCAYGCEASSGRCRDEGGGATGGTNFGAPPSGSNPGCADCYAACASCAGNPCVPGSACATNQACYELWACTASCTTSECDQLCRLLHPDGAAPYDAFRLCIGRDCLEVCGSG